MYVQQLVESANFFSLQEWEGWSMLDSSYFCFITLTTIGFGDLVPDQKNTDGELRIALCSLYLLFGIAMICMSFNLVQEEVINSVKGIAMQLGIIKDDDDEDDWNKSNYKETKSVFSSWIFTDPGEKFSIESPLLPEFRMVHIIEIGCVQNCLKAVDFLPKKICFYTFLSFSVNLINIHLAQS